MGKFCKKKRKKKKKRKRKTAKKKQNKKMTKSSDLLLKGRPDFSNLCNFYNKKKGKIMGMKKPQVQIWYFPKFNTFVWSGFWNIKKKLATFSQSAWQKGVKKGRCWLAENVIRSKIEQSVLIRLNHRDMGQRNLPIQKPITMT